MRDGGTEGPTRASVHWQNTPAGGFEAGPAFRSGWLPGPAAAACRCSVDSGPPQRAHTHAVTVTHAHTHERATRARMIRSHTHTPRLPRRHSVTGTP